MNTVNIILVMVMFAGGAAFADSRSSLCKKYEGAYISYYDGLYQVRGCKRYDKSSSAYQITKSGARIQQVGADVITQIPLAKTSDKPAKTSKSAVCKKLEGKYVSVSFTDIYYVSDCQRRLFPNWETYQEHRQRRTSALDDLIVPVSKAELQSLPTGEPVSSTAMIVKKKVNSASIQQRCRELENKYVSFYRHIYQIKNCKRKVVRYDAFKQSGAAITRELTAEEWRSFTP